MRKYNHMLNIKYELTPSVLYFGFQYHFIEKKNEHVRLLIFPRTEQRDDQQKLIKEYIFIRYIKWISYFDSKIIFIRISCWWASSK